MFRHALLVFVDVLLVVKHALLLVFKLLVGVQTHAVGWCSSTRCWFVFKHALLVGVQICAVGWFKHALLVDVSLNMRCWLMFSALLVLKHKLLAFKHKLLVDVQIRAVGA